MKSKCSFDGCKKKVNVVTKVGHCKFCSKDYCSVHRLVEDHKCPEIKSCHQAAKDVNTNKLMSEQCVSIKLEGI